MGVLERGAVLAVTVDCIGWAVKAKAGEYVSDGGGSSRPVDLAKGEPVVFESVMLDVEPCSFHVVRQNTGEHVEVRKHFVARS